ncbi:MAG: 16S rRNA (cytosine(1402)-N(4))-methyltransferase RsmH [Bdellovibrionota bacterium]
MTDEQKPKRRVRYKGTHPKSFQEKYKELSADPSLIEKLHAKGKTPAGTHRPIMVSEILEILDPRPGETGVDATLGYGGHSTELLARIAPDDRAKKGRLVAFDRDPIEIVKTTERLKGKGFAEVVFTPVLSNYANLEKEITRLGLRGKVDFLLADLGLSSMQIDDPSRGFTFKRPGPLDLRMNPSQGEPASALLAKASEADLARWLEENSDEPRAKQLAKAIVDRRKKLPILTTTDLADTIRDWMKKLGPNVREKEGELPLKRAFQALRIETNQEFSSLDAFLEALPKVLAPGARVAILSFHSGEDRRVKKALQKLHRDGYLEEISPEALRPTPEEQRSNTRSKPAKLRWGRRSHSS